MTDLHPLTILFAAVFTNNILLSNFLGICPFVAVSGEIKTSLGMGQAVTFVLACTSVINYAVYHWILVPLELDFIRFILFILVIATFVQLVEMIIGRFFKELSTSLGIFLPLITVNCAILGVSLFMVIREYNLVQTLFYGIGSGIGWTFAIVVMAGIRQKMKFSPMPEGLKGVGITFITAGIMALAFLAFSGLIKIQ